LVNAGVSGAGKAFSSATCDYAFFTVSELNQVKSIVASLTELAGKAGRTAGSMRALCGVTVIMGGTPAEAEEKRAWMESTLDWQAATNHLQNLLGGAETFQKRFTGVERDEQIRSIGLGAGGCQIVGTAADVAEQLIDAYRSGGLRGVTISSPLWSVEEITLLADVFPLLEKAGVWTPPEQRDWSW
jgi:FMNH2-dependent dimethyl sulfone monooxygenase